MPSHHERVAAAVARGTQSKELLITHESYQAITAAHLILTSTTCTPVEFLNALHSYHKACYALPFIAEFPSLLQCRYLTEPDHFTPAVAVALQMVGLGDAIPRIANKRALGNLHELEKQYYDDLKLFFAYPDRIELANQEARALGSTIDFTDILKQETLNYVNTVAYEPFESDPSYGEKEVFLLNNLMTLDPDRPHTYAKLVDVHLRLHQFKEMYQTAMKGAELSERLGYKFNTFLLLGQAGDAVELGALGPTYRVGGLMEIYRKALDIYDSCETSSLLPPLLCTHYEHMVLPEMREWMSKDPDAVYQARKPSTSNIQYRICNTCGIERFEMQKCSRCKKQYYCSRKCQQLDWKSHKKDCVPCS